MHIIANLHFSYDNWVEIIATSTGLISVLLASRGSIWNFFFGIINSGSFFFLFHDNHLYADMVLHAIYVGFNIYGIYEWHFGGKKGKNLPIYSARWLEIGYSIIITGILAYLLHFVLVHTKSTYIVLDSISTAIALVASWMLARKWIANWWYWLLGDFIAIWMMAYKHLYLSIGLYSLYCLLCIYGIYEWNQLIKKSKSSTA